MIKIDFTKELESFTLDIDFTIKKGEFIAISGDSGSGKSTTLRVIAGLEEAKGEIEVFGKKWLSDKSFLPPQKRNIGFVFQNYSLFENMSVIENILYASNDIEFAKYLLYSVNLYNKKNTLPRNLSGGEQQRVALCRALISKPQLLLLDEPLSSLDSKIKILLQEEIKKLTKEFNTTTILVSHSNAEIQNLASRVFKMHKGQILEQDKIQQDILIGSILEVNSDFTKIIVGDNIIKTATKRGFKLGQTVQLDINIT